MAIRVAINGFGRIGRTVFRIILDKHQDVEVVAINDIQDHKALLHLLKYDSVMGPLRREISFNDGELKIDNFPPIKMLSERDLSKLPWKELKIDFVIESTGVFRKRAQLEAHLEAGAPKVLLTVPAKDPIDATIVLGVNEQELKPTDKIISNASCTTNCLAPIVKVLHDNFTIKSGMMTTVHAYTNDQKIVDAPHKDFRRSRAAASNIIPTTTGAAIAVTKIIPELEGKIDGMAMRVPVVDGSVVDLVTVLEKEASIEEINAAMKKAASEAPLKGYLEYTEDPIVSSDIVGNPHSSIFDAASTSVLGAKGDPSKKGHVVKTISWYDNEFGYSSRVVDLIKLAYKISQ